MQSKSVYPVSVEDNDKDVVVYLFIQPKTDR